jgi:transcriptional regulator of arginine metabolism
MKTARQNLILDIIKNNEVETQDELAKALVDSGVNITQATVSRDIKELNLIKVQTENGRYKYAASSNDKQVKNLSVLIRVFKTTVKSIKTASNIIVIKTISGSANIVGETVDSLDMDGVIGTLAGDNTIFVATKSDDIAVKIAETLLDMIK